MQTIMRTEQVLGRRLSAKQRQSILERGRLVDAREDTAGGRRGVTLLFADNTCMFVRAATTGGRVVPGPIPQVRTVPIGTAVTYARARETNGSANGRVRGSRRSRTTSSSSDDDGPEPPPRICRGCGTELVVTDPRQRYCPPPRGDRCRKRAQRDRERAELERPDRPDPAEQWLCDLLECMRQADIAPVYARRRFSASDESGAPGPKLAARLRHLNVFFDPSIVRVPDDGEAVEM
jgi:hypothetical protein